MAESSQWPEWATVKTDHLSREEARRHLHFAQGFWRDFALAGLTLTELRQVIEDRRRKGPGARIAVPATSFTPQSRRTSSRPDITAIEVNEWLMNLPEVPHA